MIYIASLLIIAACMLAEAFFSGMETGMISIHRLRLRHFVKQGSSRARILQRFLDNPDRLLGTTLTGTNLCVVIISVIAAGMAMDLWGAWAEAASSAVVTLVLLAFCEYLPKAWFHSKPFERCSRLAPVLALAEKVLSPLSLAIIWLTRWIVPGPSAPFSKAEASLTREELKVLTREGEKDGALSAAEGAMINRVFELSSKRARDIMVPRPKMATVRTDTTLPEFFEAARSTGFTRLPVFDREKGTFPGIVNVFAVVSAPPESRGKTVAGFVRPPLLIPEGMPVDDILPKMRRSRQPMCLVVNERNEVTGLLTNEDILEEIVGTL